MSCSVVGSGGGHPHPGLAAWHISGQLTEVTVYPEPGPDCILALVCFLAFLGNPSQLQRQRRIGFGIFKDGTQYVNCQSERNSDFG